MKVKKIIMAITLLLSPVFWWLADYFLSQVTEVSVGLDMACIVSCFAMIFMCLIFLIEKENL